MARAVLSAPGGPQESSALGHRQSENWVPAGAHRVRGAQPSLSTVPSPDLASMQGPPLRVRLNFTCQSPRVWGVARSIHPLLLITSFVWSP